MIVEPDTVSSTVDIVVKYVNRLLEDIATAQHMLATQKPADAHLQVMMRELRGENTKLKAQTQGMQDAMTSVIHAQEHAERQWLAEATALRQTVENLQSVNASLESANLYLKSQFEAARRREDDLSVKHKAFVEEREWKTTAPRTKAQGIDGDAAIQDGNDALGDFVGKTRQPGRGE